MPANAWASARQYVAGHRLAEESGEARSLRGRSQVVWAGPDGEALVELNLIAGLGHGTPVAAAAAEPVGEAAPFSLEAGVSSSLEIARFWGLAPPAKDEVEWTDAPSASEPASTLSPSLAGSVLDSVSPHVPEDIRQVIAKALASAGLRR